MNVLETSIIIRTRNEERWIGEVLKRLYSQTYKNFEVIIIDSGSTDKTLDIVSNFPIKLIKIKPEEFSYPYALNIGIKNSNAEKYLVILSAHSLPISDNWLASGIEHFSKDDNIMGVYGPLKALPDGTFWDKRFHLISYLKEFKYCFPKKYRKVEEGGMGVLGFTNAVIKKDLWDKHNFNEDYGAGGEDGEWAGYWLERGYYAIKDIRFTVLHSHYLNLLQWKQQFGNWSGLHKPQLFKYLSYRNDGAHRK